MLKQFHLRCPSYYFTLLHSEPQTCLGALLHLLSHKTSKFLSLFFLLAQQPPVGQGLLIHEFSRSHTQRSTTVGRTPLDDWSARRRDLYLTAHDTHNRHPYPGGIRTNNLSRRAAADLRFRPCGHWDRQRYLLLVSQLRRIALYLYWNFFLLCTSLFFCTQRS